MCEIQFLKRIDNKNISERDFVDFIKFMSLGNTENNHAFGLFNSKGIFKCQGDFNYKKIDDNFIKSDNFIVGHNRFATNRSFFEDSAKGIIKAGSPIFTIDANEDRNFIGLTLLNFFNEERKIKKKNSKKEIPFNDNINNHPFKLGDFTIVHNGIIFNDKELRKKYNIKTDITTDSYVILWLINKLFNASKLANRRKRVIDSITKAMNEVEGGYSVILFDKETKDLFYFKNWNTNFVFKLLGNRLLVGSTKPNNFEYVYGNKKNIFCPKPDTIYLISEYPIKKVGNISQRIEMKGGKYKW